MSQNEKELNLLFTVCCRNVIMILIASMILIFKNPRSKVCSFLPNYDLLKNIDP